MDVMVTLAPVERERVAEVAEGLAARHGIRDLQVFARFRQLAGAVDGPGTLDAIRSDPAVQSAREAGAMHALR